MFHIVIPIDALILEEDEVERHGIVFLRRKELWFVDRQLQAAQHLRTRL